MNIFEKTKEHFHIPDGVIYLDGNSLGPLPLSAVERSGNTMTCEWGEMLITGWNRAGWMAMPGKVGDRIGRLIGAPEKTVMTGDTLSIKVYQALAAALALNPDRSVILSDRGNFPTDLYMAEGLIRTAGERHRLVTVEPHSVASAIGPDIAVLMLTHVDYRTGRMHDMADLTALAHRHGVIVIWDLAHSAGAVPVDLQACNAEFAVGCTYKYLNGGPGAPAFIYVREDLADSVEPALSGWLGHDAPFAFEPGYRPAMSIERMRVGTPPILQLAVLDAALDAWDGVSMTAVREQSIRLSETFIREVEDRCPDLELASPRDPAARGSQVSFRTDHGYPMMQALIAQGVIGDFRAPDLIRFGFTPLYLSEDDVVEAAGRLETIVREKSWDKPEYHQRSAVT